MVYNIYNLYTSFDKNMYSYASLSIMSSNGGISSFSSGMKSWTIPCISVYNWNNWFSKFSRLEIVTCKRRVLPVAKLSYILTIAEFPLMLAVRQRPK